MKETNILEKLFKQLNRRILTRDLIDQFIPFGLVGYNFLESRIASPDATELQIVNSLQIMNDWKWSRLIDRSKFFMLLLRMSKDHRKKVRSVAIGLAVGLTNWAMQDPTAVRIPEAQRDLVMPWAEDALALGLEENYARLVKSFITGEF